MLPGSRALKAALQCPDGEVAEQHRDRREPAEPDDHVEVADGRQPDVADEVRLPEPVEGFWLSR